MVAEEKVSLGPAIINSQDLLQSRQEVVKKKKYINIIVSYSPPCLSMIGYITSILYQKKFIQAWNNNAVE